MAIARGAGTEILRSAHFNDVDSTSDTKILIGEQHHIYTVLNITIYALALGSTGSVCQMNFVGYDSKDGSGGTMRLFTAAPQQYETFVWNDRFVFNGSQPTDFAGPMDDTTKQDALADMGSSTANYLITACSHANDSYRIHISFIDQNNE